MMIRRVWAQLLLGGAMVVSVAATGCKELADRTNCDTICEHIRDCDDADLKVARCSDDCFDAIDGHNSLEDDARKCANCIDSFVDRTCSEVTADCDTCDDVIAVFMGGASGM